MSVLAGYGFPPPQRSERRGASERRPAAAGRSATARSDVTAPGGVDGDTALALVTALLDRPGVGIALCGPDGVLTTVNQAFEDLVGAERVTRAATTLLRCCGLWDAAGVPVHRGADPLSRALRGERVDAEVLSVGRRGGTMRSMRCSAYQLRNADGTVRGAALVAVDVTDCVSQRRQLELLRDDLVGAVNHEVRTPLAIIAGHMELISDQAEPAPEVLGWSLGAIGRATTQLGAVVDSISEIADGSLRAVPTSS
ncbi:MAG: PAS domain-containing protein [Marmoricola sp.]